MWAIFCSSRSAYISSVQWLLYWHHSIKVRSSAETLLVSMRIASLWQLLSRCSLRLCCVIVLHGTSVHTALPSGARTCTSLLQQMLHNIPCSPQSSSNITSHGKLLTQDGLIPVLRCFEVPGFLPAVGGGLFLQLKKLLHQNEVTESSFSRDNTRHEWYCATVQRCAHAWCGQTHKTVNEY